MVMKHGVDQIVYQIGKKYGENQTGTELGTLIENSTLRYLMAVLDMPGLLKQNISLSFLPIVNFIVTESIRK
jgi:hypothetical protein